MTTILLYDQIVAITEDYLGPAARRFVSRQILFHLHKQPTELALEDVPKLVEWTNVTLALLTEDQTMVKEYGHKMQKLIES